MVIAEKRVIQETATFAGGRVQEKSFLEQI